MKEIKAKQRRKIVDSNYINYINLIEALSYGTSINKRRIEKYKN